MKGNEPSADEQTDWATAIDWYRKITGGPVAATALGDLELWAMQKPERIRMIMRLFQMNAATTEVRSEYDRLQALYQDAIGGRDRLMAEAQTLPPSECEHVERILQHGRLEETLATIATAMEACLSIATGINASLLAMESTPDDKGQSMSDRSEHHEYDV